MVKKLIAHVSAIFLLPVFEKSVILYDFRAIAHSISAREGGSTVCCNAMVRNWTGDHSVTYCFPWKHPMARRRGENLAFFCQTPPKWARRLGPTGLAARSSFIHKTTIAKASARPFGPCHFLFRRLCTKTQPKLGLLPACLAFGASQMHRAPEPPTI